MKIIALALLLSILPAVSGCSSTPSTSEIQQKETQRKAEREKQMREAAQKGRSGNNSGLPPGVIVPR
jgi:uncharacterized protein YceK